MDTHHTLEAPFSACFGTVSGKRPDAILNPTCRKYFENLGYNLESSTIQAVKPI